MRKFITTIIAVCMIMSLVACSAKEGVNESKALDEQQQRAENGEKFVGVFRGDDFTIVFAQNVEAIENFNGDIKIAIDMGYDFFFPYTAKIVSNTEITDFTYRGGEVVTEFNFKLEGDTLYYHRLIHEDNYEDNITLKRTDDDPIEVYNELLQKSGESVSQNLTTDTSNEASEQAPEVNPQPDVQGGDTEAFPYIDITYRAQEYDGILIFQKPNEEGLPTEIVIDGKTYELEDYYMVYDAAKDAWTGGGTGNNPDGNIGISLSGNNEKWMLWISGAFDMTSAYFGDDTQEGTDTTPKTGNYSFVGVTYKHENLDLTFQLKTPDANGNPTEVLFDGDTYNEVSFKKETFTLSNVSITLTSTNTYLVNANLSIGEQTHEFYIEDAGDGSWKMYGPGMCSGYYYPE